MARVLNALERSVLLNQVNPGLGEEVKILDANPSVSSDLVYPRSGRSVRWPDGSYTLVWRDATFRWWFVDVTRAFAAEVSQPEYHTADESFLHNVIEETEEMVKAGLQKLPTIPQIGFGVGVAAVFVVVVLLARK